MKLGAKRGELVQLMQKFMPRNRIGIFQNEHTDPHHWKLNLCFGAFCNVWVHLEPFRYCTKLSAKRTALVQLLQKFVPQEIFCNKRTQSTPLNPKLMFWCIL
jgi:hypothetical protein